MKTLKKHIGKFSFILAMLILIQGCKVYHKDSVSLQQAAESGKRAKIETNYNQKLSYYKIVYEDGQYFGVLKHSDQISKFPIIVNNIVKVRLQNKTLSTVYTVLMPVALLGIAFIVFAIDSKNYWDDFLEDIENN